MSVGGQQRDSEAVALHFEILDANEITEFHFTKQSIYSIFFAGKK